MLQILGLELCADTMVGDDLLRGISGGQRKRVTIGKRTLNSSTSALLMTGVLNNCFLIIWMCVIKILQVRCWSGRPGRFSWTRDLNRSRQLHHVPDCELAQAVHPCPRWHRRHLPAAACARDLQPVRRHHPALRWPGRIPRSPGGRGWLLRVYGVQMPREEGCRRLLARSAT